MKIKKEQIDSNGRVREFESLPLRQYSPKIGLSGFEVS